MSRSLRTVIEPEQRGNVARLAKATGVSWMTAWRWTLPADHAKHSVPRVRYWPAIERYTVGRWRPPWDYFSGRPAAYPPPPAPRTIDLSRVTVRIGANHSGMSAVLKSTADPPPC